MKKSDSKRIYQVAKDYNISSDALLSMLRELGFTIRSHMSVVDENMLKAIENKFRKEKEELKKEDVLKRKKLQEREKLEEERHRLENVKERLKVRDTGSKKKEEALPLEKKRKATHHDIPALTQNITRKITPAIKPRRAVR